MTSIDIMREGFQLVGDRRRSQYAKGGFNYGKNKKSGKRSKE